MIKPRTPKWWEFVGTVLLVIVAIAGALLVLATLALFIALRQWGTNK